MRLIKWFSIAWFATVLFISPAMAQKLIVTSMSPAGGDNSVDWFGPWAARVNAQGKGVIEVEVRDGTTLANFANVYERVSDDVVQIGWMLPGMVGGRFGLTEVSGLPFLTDSAEEGSVALWRLYKSGLLASEYQDIVPLVFAVFPQFQLHFHQRLRVIDSLQGLKIASTGRTGLEVVERLGGTPISISPDDYYTGLQRGTIDGVLMAWSAFDTYKLAEVTSFHIETPLGTTPSVMFMSKKKYEALPAAARKVLDDNSGEIPSREFGALLDRRQQRMRAPVASATSKQTIIQLSPAQTEKWRQETDPVVEAWVKSHPNGEAVLSAYRKILAQVKTEEAGSPKQ